MTYKGVCIGGPLDGKVVVHGETIYDAIVRKNIEISSAYMPSDPEEDIIENVRYFFHDIPFNLQTEQFHCRFWWPSSVKFSMSAVMSKLLNGYGVKGIPS